MSVLMRTMWGKPGFTSARRGRAALSPYRPARRPMQAEPDAALPPRSAPRSEHFARFEGKVSETPRAAADRDAAAPAQDFPAPLRHPDQEKVGFVEGTPPGFSPTARGIPDIFHDEGKCPF